MDKKTLKLEKSHNKKFKADMLSSHVRFNSLFCFKKIQNPPRKAEVFFLDGRPRLRLAPTPAFPAFRPSANAPFRLEA